MSHRPLSSGRWPLAAMLLLVATSGGCLQQIAMNSLADALSGTGDVFASDNDPELIRDAAPFSLKLMESVLAETPRHRALLTATAGSFTQYAYAFVQQESDEVETTDVAAANALRDRARKLLLRGRNYGLRGLDVAHKGFSSKVRNDPKQAVSIAEKKDVPLLYWTAASWAAAISISKEDPSLVSDQVIVEALLDRALELDETYEHGAIQALLISYEPARQGAGTPVEDRVRKHFQRAVELSEGRMAAPYVALAEAICVQKQDRVEWESLLKRALQVDVDTVPKWRLSNILAQRRARWLLGRTSELFIE